MKFVALDFETANESLDSICQIGVASFADGRLVGSWETLVDPEDHFSGMNISVHGITPKHVKGVPRFSDVFEHLRELLADGEAVAHHTAFDRAALGRTIEKYELDAPNCNWLDTARVVRRTWPECASADTVSRQSQECWVSNSSTTQLWRTLERPVKYCLEPSSNPALILPAGSFV